MAEDKNAEQRRSLAKYLEIERKRKQKSFSEFWLNLGYVFCLQEELVLLDEMEGCYATMNATPLFMRWREYGGESILKALVY